MDRAARLRGERRGEATRHATPRDTACVDILCLHRAMLTIDRSY
jgi:hypothetical protein